ncbi:MAG TPA: RNA 3'-terminal phosphate cyclase [Polyangia bacterium]|nr:RNA 3'-terminal phosphate cyclase [Polyangia bacterium]
MLTIDGAQGEGGGQILRSSLALSLVTGTPFRMVNVRARRSRPGLLRQHLCALRAAAEVGAAEVSGAELGAREIEFRPGAAGARAGEYTFSVGTAGSATLVLQTVLPALVRLVAASALTLEGGTHNPAAPPFDFLAQSFLPLLARMGPLVSATLERPGFYPAGGGRIRARIEPAPLKPLELLQRGALTAPRVRAVVAALPRTIAEREVARLAARLRGHRSCFQVEEVADPIGPGNVVMIELPSAHVTELFTGFGERGVRAEAVADRVAREAEAYLAADVPVGPHLADQLLLPMALAGGGRFRTLAPTAHTRTQIEVLQKFLGLKVGAEPESDRAWRIEVGL